MLDNPIKYKVACFRIDEKVGVGVERYHVEDGQAVIEFIGSYHIGDSSRQDSVRFYVREIMRMHGPDDEIHIRIADPNLRYKIRSWLTSVYPERVRFKIEPTGVFKTCQMLAADACFRGCGTSITEKL